MATALSTIAEVQLDIRFSPFDQTTEPFLELVQSAKKSIFVVIYGFTLAPLIDDLIAKHQAGLEIGLILDHTQSLGRAERVQVKRLLDAGVPFEIGHSPSHSAILHSKFVVVDELHVETGSWNFSVSAAQQSNNMLLIKGHPEVAKIYLRHYDRLRAIILHHQSQLQLTGEAPDPLALAEDASLGDTPVAPDATPAAPLAAASAEAVAVAAPARRVAARATVQRPPQRRAARRVVAAGGAA